MLRSAVCALSALSLLLPLLPERAEACSQPQPGWFVHDDGSHRADVAPVGVIALKATLEGWNMPSPTDALNVVSIRVMDLQEVVQTGSIEYVAPLRAIVWRADEPLVPGAGYRFEYSIDNSGFFGGDVATEGAFTFEVATFPPERFGAPIATSVELTEDRRGVNEVCCERAECIPIDCGPVSDHCDLCWPENYEYRPKLEATYPATDELAIARPVIWADEAVPTIGEPLTNWGDDTYRVRHVFDAPAEAYCVALELELLVDGSKVMTEPTCIANVDMEALERLPVLFDALQYCAELPPGYDEDGPTDPTRRLGVLDTGEPTCGCSTTTGYAPRSSWLAALGLLWFGLRRRKSKTNSSAR